jgi:hypothetical protein
MRQDLNFAPSLLPFEHQPPHPLIYTPHHASSTNTTALPAAGSAIITYLNCHYLFFPIRTMFIPRLFLKLNKSRQNWPNITSTKGNVPMA